MLADSCPPLDLASLGLFSPPYYLEQIYPSTVGRLAVGLDTSMFFASSRTTFSCLEDWCFSAEYLLFMFMRSYSLSIHLVAEYIFRMSSPIINFAWDVSGAFILIDYCGGLSKLSDRTRVWLGLGMKHI